LIRSHENEKYYLCPRCVNFEGDKGFDEAFEFNMDELLRNLLDRNNDHETAFNPIKINRVIIKHMGLKLPGCLGTLALSAEPEILNLINQVGLGSRRGQGFGMVELVREI
jgi:CRISPR-associated endoribonuclease Cas6